MARKSLNRREFLKRAGIVTGGAMAMMALDPLSSFANNNDEKSQGNNNMTYRTQNGTGERVSLLGFGMMRLPRDNQELVN
ncbi:MAG: twin-arginine translocation signal domain-containing protein, partial [Muribaculaceae bacterium]|nr:twin-arginine translocation signal domain-containing protein [Muribaculaceae bacterium]